MKYISINRVNAGDKLGKDLVDDSGRILLRKDSVLTERMIGLLITKGLQYIYVDDELSRNIEIEEVIPQSLKRSTIQYLKKLNIEETIEYAKTIVDKLLGYKNLSVDVYVSDFGSDALYEHSLAVAQFAVLFGNALGYNQNELNQIAVASLLHDIGKVCMNCPEYIVKYNMQSVFNSLGIELPESYDDRYHPLYGYAMLKGTAIDSVVKSSVLRHHENYDNTGIIYRKSSLNDNGISTQFAKIINISDTFVRLMTNTYSDAKVANITEAIEYMEMYSGKKFDKKYVIEFFRNVPILPKGLTVDLSNGMQAVIAEVNMKMPTRPKIMVDGEIYDLTDPDLQHIVINNISGVEYSIDKQL